jgi:hypothetical protein
MQKHTEIAAARDAERNIDVEIAKATAAEKHYYGEGFPTNFPKHDIIKAHEAGQKHGAGVERERHSEIVDLCKYIARHYKIIFAQSASSNTFQRLERALKNLESDTEPEQGSGLSEKPSRAEPEIDSIDAQLIDITHSHGQGVRVTTCRIISDGWRDFLPRQKFKLTPIKD